MPPPGVCLNILNERNKKTGKGSPTNPDNFLDQDYEQLHQYCLIRKMRYIDEMFPPDKTSIGQGLLLDDDLARVVWMRPSKMVGPDAEFVVQGVSRFDFGQGALGNCWFLASIGALTFQKDIMMQVIPSGQSYQEGYAGIFHFRFWRFGKWVDVVIDDKLPTINGRLVFVHMSSPNEFWAALFEKAYAKVCGSYADMMAGNVAEAVMDFTGGVHVTYQLNDPPPDLWDLMYRAFKSTSLMGCGTPQGKTSANTVLSNGIVEGHAYTITGVSQVTSHGTSVKLVRLFNPWGQGEWNGDWSDKSPTWQTVSAEDRKRCLIVEDNGEFWMTMEDFCRYYTDVDICSVYPDFLDATESHWTSKSHDGRWVAGTTAGGCLTFKDNSSGQFWTNPQYHIELSAVDDNCYKDQGPKNILVTLLQKPDKRNRRLVSNLYIGFYIFELPPHLKGKKGKLPASFFDTNTSIAQTKSLLNAREVMALFRLKPGHYIIVPTTYKMNETASFILVILSKAETHTQETSHESMVITKPTPTSTDQGGDKDKAMLFRQYSNEYQEVDAEHLQKLLNENIPKEAVVNTGGFGIDSCRSMVAMMDLSVTGTLNGREFIRLWDRVDVYKEIFLRTDTSRDGILQVNELRNAVEAAGMQMSDSMLNILALRYGGSSGRITLDSFVCLILRLECMAKTFRRLSDAGGLLLSETEWMYLSMYS